MADNYWDKLMGSDEHAGSYMATYGEGPGFDTRHTIASFINNGESVLDVGCGPGWNLDHFAEHGPALSTYKGVDYSIRFVRAANLRRECSSENYQSIQVEPFEKQDCRQLQEPDGSYDVVILQDVLEHTNGYDKPVREALRVARKRVIISFWHMLERDEDEHINNDGDDGYGAWYSQPRWEKFLDDLGVHWLHFDIRPKDKGHPWDFYIIDKEQS